MRNESLKKHALFRYIAIVICALVGIQLLFQSSGWNPSSNLSKNQCQSQNSASLPTLVLLKTKLNVDYDAGQWFHMTENYLVHHSRLELGGQLINSSHIIYVFDEDGFEAKLNEFTKFIIIASTISGDVIPSKIDFTSDSNFFTQPLPPNQILPLTLHRRQICVRYRATIGGDVMPRDQWFLSPSSVQSLKLKFQRMCQNLKIVTPKKPSKHRLLIYQRDKTRKIINEQFMLQSLNTSFPSNSWDIQMIYHDNRRPVCELMTLLSQVDVLLTPHGFQSILLLFLPPSAMIFEIFPNHYYKQVYKVIANSIGVGHAHVISKTSSSFYSFFFSAISPEICMKNILCRVIARWQNVKYESYHSKLIKEKFEEHHNKHKQLVDS